MNNDELEKKTDELLAALGKEFVKSDVKFADRIMSEMEEKTVVPIAPKRHSGKMFRRTIALVAVLVIVIGASIVSVDGLKEKIFKDANDMESSKPTHTEVVPFSGHKSEAIPDFEFGYLPEGFVLASSDEDEKIGLWQTYMNKEKKLYLDFTISYKEPGGDKNILNTYRSELFEGQATYYVETRIKDYTVNLYTNLNKKEILKIVDNIKIK